MFLNVEHPDFIKKFYEQIKLFEFEVNDSFAMSNVYEKKREFVHFFHRKRNNWIYCIKQIIITIYNFLFLFI